MNVIVCVKQVPEIAQIKVDDSAGKVIYPSGPGMMNPFDDYAVEEAIRIKEKLGGKATSLSLGMQAAEPTLRHCLSLGVDEAVLVKVENPDQIDAYATAQILSLAVRKISDFHLILCGKQAVDGDSSLTPPALAEWLSLPQVTFVKKFDSLSENQATVWRTTEEGYDVIDVSLPAVVSVVKEINEPRLPSLKGKMRAKSAPLTTWSLSDLGLDEEKIVSGSLIRMSSFATPPDRPKGEIISADSPAEAVDQLVAKLREAQVI